MATGPAAMVTPLAHSGALIHKRTDGRLLHKSEASRSLLAPFRDSSRSEGNARRTTSLSTPRRKRSKGEGTGEKGAYEAVYDGGGGGGGRRGERRRARVAGAGRGERRRAHEVEERVRREGEGWRKKGERAATPHVCFSTRRHGDPLAFVTVMGWENTEPGGARVSHACRGHLL